MWTAGARIGAINSTNPAGKFSDGIIDVCSRKIVGCWTSSGIFDVSIARHRPFDIRIRSTETLKSLNKQWIRQKINHIQTFYSFYQYASNDWCIVHITTQRGERNNRIWIWIKHWLPGFSSNAKRVGLFSSKTRKYPTEFLFVSITYVHGRDATKIFS